MTLTKRQEKILTMLCDGERQKAIADALKIKLGTLESYLVRMRARFGARSVTQLVVFFCSVRVAGKTKSPKHGR